MIDPAQSLKLNFTNLSEGDSLDAETWLYSPDSENGKTDDDLTEWLEGGTGKINYSTRSALTRRLEKKSKKKEKKSDKEEKRLSVRGKALSKIDEDSCESNLHSESGRGRNAVVANTHELHLAASDGILTPNDAIEDDEIYYDAKEQVTPKKSNSSREDFLRITSSNSNSPLSYVSAKTSTSNQQYNHLDHNGIFNGSHEGSKLSEIERRAREQERELQMELQHHSFSVNPTPKSSRPGSASSAVSYTQPGGLPASRSTDFRSSKLQNTQSVFCQNEQSLALDLSNVAEELLNQTLATRLPLPRPVVVPGRTSIPLPTPKRGLKSRRSLDHPSSECLSSYVSSCGSGARSEAGSVHNGDECY